MKLTQEQLQAIWTELPYDSIAEIETKLEDEPSPVSVSFLCGHAYSPRIFFNLTGEEITEEEYNQN